MSPIILSVIDYWFYIIGVNVIPINSRRKIPLVAWIEYQDQPISKEQFEKWKNNGDFDNGVAIIAGKIWRGAYKGKYLTCIDIDNKKGLEVFLSKFGKMTTINKIAEKTVVEQHLDNTDKAHIYFIVEKPLTKKSGIGVGNQKQSELEIPAIEVKSEGKHGIMIVSPSIHKNGRPYEIIGTKKPTVLNEQNSIKLEDTINDIYKEYNLTYEYNNKIPIEGLFKDDFKVREGSNRHEALLRAMESLLKRNSSILSEIQIKELANTWNQEHCKPPLDDKEFEKQWDCAKTFIISKSDNSEQKDNAIPYKNDELIEKLININPEVTYYADLTKKIIGKKYIDWKFNEETNKKEPITIFSSIYIDAIPTKIKIFKNNPLLKSNFEQIEITFESSNVDGNIVIGPYDNLKHILKELENRHLLLNSGLIAFDALSCIVNAYKEKKVMIEYLDGITTEGYYLIKEEIRTFNIKQTSSIDKNKAIKCIEYLDHLANQGWKNKNIFPTVLKWGIVSPFSFSIKFNSNEKWMPWLNLYGQSRTGKTTLGKLALYIWNLDVRNHSLGFNNIDTPARLGHSISKSTYPYLINETGVLSSNTFGKYNSIIELIKHSIESTICRGKYYEGLNYKEILALSPFIFTSNLPPVSDAGYNRRFVSINFPENEKKDSEQEEFGSLLEENKKYLSVLGDYAANFIKENPKILTEKEWNDIAVEVLESFYKFAEKPRPHWIDFIEEQRDPIDESTERTVFELRAFFIDRINEDYARNYKSHPTLVDPYLNNDIFTKLNFLLRNKVVSFLHEISNHEIIITIDILKELRKNQNIENITTLKDVGNLIDFKYGFRYVHGRKMRVLIGDRTSLVGFLDSIREDP